MENPENVITNQDHRYLAIVKLLKEVEFQHGPMGELTVNTDIISQLENILKPLSQEQQRQLMIIRTAEGLTPLDLMSPIFRTAAGLNVFRTLSGKSLTAQEQSEFLLRRGHDNKLYFIEKFFELTEHEKENLLDYISKNNVVITRADLNNSVFYLTDFFHHAFPEKTRGELTFSKDENGNIPLHGIWHSVNVTSFIAYLKFAPEQLRAKALLTHNNQGLTPLYGAVYSLRTLGLALTTLDNAKDLTPGQIADAILYEDELGRVPLEEVINFSPQDSYYDRLKDAGSTQFPCLELLLKRLSEDQLIDGLAKKRKDGKTVLYKIFFRIAREKDPRNEAVSDEEEANLLELKVKNLLQLLPKQNPEIKKALLNLEDLEHSPLFSLAKNPFGTKAVNIVLVELGIQPITQEEIQKFGGIYKAINRKLFPQSTIAQDIMALKKSADELEKKTLLEELARLSGAESSIENSEEIASHKHFENTIKKSYMVDIFYDVKPDKYPKGKDFQAFYESRLKVIEQKIRETILNEILKGFDTDLKNTKLTKEEREKIDGLLKWIDDNNQKLISGDPEALAYVRPHFNSVTVTAQIAWRCYDPGALMQGPYPNFFIPPSLSQKNQIVFSTAAAQRAFTGEETKATQENYSNKIRERAAYYFLLAKDKIGTAEQQQDRIDSFINYLAEIRRANNKNSDPKAPDFGSCGPGHFTRLAKIAPTHPLAPVPLSRHATVKREMSEIIIKKFSEALRKLADEDKLKFLMALIMLNDQNADTIEKHPEEYTKSTGLDVSTAELLKFRLDFINSLGQAGYIIKAIDTALVNDFGEGLTSPELIYITLACTNVGGTFVAARLNSSYKSSIEPAPPSAELKANKEEEEFPNPYPFSSETKIVSKMPEEVRVQMEASRKKEIMKHYSFQELFHAFCRTFFDLSKETSGKKEIFVLTNSLIDKIFGEIPAKDLQKEGGLKNAVGKISSEDFEKILKEILEDSDLKKVAEKISNPNKTLPLLKAAFEAAQNAFELQQKLEQEKREKGKPLTTAFNVQETKEEKEKKKTEEEQNVPGSGAQSKKRPPID